MEEVTPGQDSPEEVAIRLIKRAGNRNEEIVMSDNMAEHILTGLERIAAERKRQVEQEGFDEAHDAQHPDGSMAAAAACYAMDEPIYIKDDYANGCDFKDPWPWDVRFDKRPRNGNVIRYDLTHEERLDLLIKAGALIAAEIDNMLHKVRQLFGDPIDDPKSGHPIVDRAR